MKKARSRVCGAISTCCRRRRRAAAARTPALTQPLLFHRPRLQMTHANVGSLLVFDPSKLHLVRRRQGNPGAPGVRGAHSRSCCVRTPARRRPVLHSLAQLQLHPALHPQLELNRTPALACAQVKCGIDQVCNASKDAVVGIITERGEWLIR